MANMAMLGWAIDAGTIIFSKNGMPTEQSFAQEKKFLSEKYGQNKNVASVFDRDADAQKIVDFALHRQKNTNKYPYSIFRLGG